MKNTAGLKKKLPAVRINSFAKINLGLLIKNKRADGYHNIETCFTSLSLRDTIYLRPWPEIRIRCNHAGVPLGPENLAYKAVLAFNRLAGREQGVNITLVKRIPVGAGLAGGSGNAAAVLKGLNRLWKAGLAPEQLIHLCRGLGSDVPYTFCGGTMLGRGRGTQLKPLVPLPRHWVVLCCLNLHVSTAWAYSQVKFALTKKNQETNLYTLYSNFLCKKTPVSSLLVNHFEGVIFKKYPELAELKQAMISCAPVGVSLSGSGPTLFALFHGYGEAAEMAKVLARHRGVRTIVCRTL